MTITLESLLDSIRTRKAINAYGISVAAAYIRAIEPCFEGGGGNGDGAKLCPVKLFGLASGELWQKEIEEAAKRLTYCDDVMAAFMTADDFATKSIREGTDITKGAVLEYDCVLSSKRKDRDGDIVEQKGGLSVDMKMPALWQHIQVQPIGKHVALLDQDETHTKSRFALADTELGRDAATLVKFGALRKSIGFRPAVFEPVEVIKGADGREQVRGWHIKQATVMEGSLVSIPANPDAAILGTYEKEFDGLATAYSRGLLKNTLVKHWAKGVYDVRPVHGRGADFVTKDGSQGPAETKATIRLGDAVVELSTKGAVDTKGKPIAGGGGKEQASGHDEGKKACPTKGCRGVLDSTGSCPSCGYNDGSSAGSPPKSTTPPATKAATVGDTFKALAELSTKMVGNEYIDGSFEKIQSSLRRTAGDYLSGKGVDRDRFSGYADLMATFADSAIVCLYNYGAAKSPCYRISYTVDGEGNATWTGEPQEVELKQTVIEKAIPSAELLAKQLVGLAVANPGSTTILKAMQDVAANYSVALQQKESRELEELLNI